MSQSNCRLKYTFSSVDLRNFPLGSSVTTNYYEIIDLEIDFLAQSHISWVVSNPLVPHQKISPLPKIETILKTHWIYTWDNRSPKNYLAASMSKGPQS